MTRHTIYSLRTDGDQFRITKFVDGEVESSYLSTETECECPAGHRPSCRHRQMIPEMLARGLCNTHWFWDFDRHHAVDFEGTPKADYDNVAQAIGVEQEPLVPGELAAIPGVQVLSLDDPAEVHNAIADAVGEPEAKLADLPPSHSAQSGDSIGHISASPTKSWRRL